MGGGRVGRSLANLLIDSGADITLIESDEALCNEVAPDLDALVICGNGTSSKLLEEANIEDADFFIATTGNDEANLLSCILVRKYNVETIVARVSNPDHEEAFKEVGIDELNAENALILNDYSAEDFEMASEAIWERAILVLKESFQKVVLKALTNQSKHDIINSVERMYS